MEIKDVLANYQIQIIKCHICASEDSPCCCSIRYFGECYCDLVNDLMKRISTKQVEKFIELCSSNRYYNEQLYNSFKKYGDVDLQALEKERLMKEYKEKIKYHREQITIYESKLNKLK